ncbi:putative ATP-grasp-modified RiPP [Actinomadura mexicana]|uniref:Putative ATP-grasp target RiPP n=1 Tax=Actinomadura mexicana TaxID=134959 RepID=A0A238UWR6_9ACTN|nr:putative ATP-grasp-modified RiPP [Actinomadura mexicana]SNR26700.1 putative ATP-grasp target RiPP [Actinomadura mexicana]
MSDNARPARQHPWGWTRITARLPEALPFPGSVTLDAATQTGRYLDQRGEVIEMGKHGTNRQTSTATRSGGGDGNTPQVQTVDDSTTDYESD